MSGSTRPKKREKIVTPGDRSTPVLIANWKMNLPAQGAAGFIQQLSSGIDDTVQTVIAPSFPFLADIARAGAALSPRVFAAGQNCSDFVSGAFTGEVAAAMLEMAGASHVILGHSERRTWFAETDDWIGRKIAAAVACGLTVVFCVGEDERTFEAGGTLPLIERQIRIALDQVSLAIPHLIFAYEPVWAIGTGKNATPAYVAGVHAAIAGIAASLSMVERFSILYGGSVTPDNSRELAQVPAVDGFLVGGASLDVSRFAAIFEATRTAAAK